MGKRSDFKRRDRDFYPTPVKAVEPLIPHLPSSFTYVEPCAGGGDLIDALDTFEGVAHDGKFSPKCYGASDIEPGISKYGVRFVQKDASNVVIIRCRLDAHTSIRTLSKELLQKDCECWAHQMDSR
jgi:hypothetical protein